MVDPLIGIVKWNTGFNISGNRNKVLNLGDIDRLGYRTTKVVIAVNTPFMYLVVGEPFGQMYGYGYEGTWKARVSPKKLLPMVNYREIRNITDVNHDGAIDENDLKVIGNAFPDFIFGWTNRLSYKNFELTFLIQGSEGNDLFNEGRIRLEESR